MTPLHWRSMLIYAGIDEAGYGPMFGPLLVGRAVFSLSDADPRAEPPPLWQRLRAAVCRDMTGHKGRILVNDSKKVYAPALGLGRLERGVLAFASLAGNQPADLHQWMDDLGETTHRLPDLLPWYQSSSERPWQPLPTACSGPEIAIAANLLAATAARAGFQVLDLGASVVFEDQFNRMVSATRSKAAASFTFVARHLLSIWTRFSHEHPRVVVDRQSGRSHYRELLAMTFPQVDIVVLDETASCSRYRLQQTGTPPRSLTVSFQVDADARHMPVALASMICKYTRELLMARFQGWFSDRAPGIKPTAGYATDAQRFWTEIQPLLPAWSIAPDQLRRQR